MEDKLQIISNPFKNFERNFMRDTVNFLRRNNISIFNKNGEYKGAEAIIVEVRAKFENS